MPGLEHLPRIIMRHCLPRSPFKKEPVLPVHKLLCRPSLTCVWPAQVPLLGGLDVDFRSYLLHDSKGFVHAACQVWGSPVRGYSQQGYGGELNLLGPSQKPYLFGQLPCRCICTCYITIVSDSRVLHVMALMCGSHPDAL